MSIRKRTRHGGDSRGRIPDGDFEKRGGDVGQEGRVRLRKLGFRRWGGTPSIVNDDAGNMALPASRQCPADVGVFYIGRWTLLAASVLLVGRGIHGRGASRRIRATLDP